MTPSVPLHLASWDLVPGLSPSLRRSPAVAPTSQRKFAYCLPDRFANLNARGTIEFGSYELPVNLRYTPLAPPYTPMGDPFYYVDLKRITLGGIWIKVAMKAHKVGQVAAGGTMFDSGSALTTLVKSLYNELVKEMKRQTAHLGPFV